MRSPRRRRLLKDCRPSPRCHLPCGSRWKSFTSPDNADLAVVYVLENRAPQSLAGRQLEEPRDAPVQNRRTPNPNVEQPQSRPHQFPPIPTGQRTYFVKLEKNCLDSRLGLSFSCIADNVNEPTQQQPIQNTCGAPCVPPTHQIGSPMLQGNRGLPRHDIEPPSIFTPPQFFSIPGKIVTLYYPTHTYRRYGQ